MSETEFERKRREQIQRNQQFLKELGLVEEAKIHPVQRKKGPTKKRSVPIQREIPRKRTLRGQSEVQVSRESARQDDTPDPVEYIDWSNATISTPFTIRSTQTTVWSLGTLELDPVYWSTSGCKFKHPYPVGYLASKFHFGQEWIMYISKDTQGPVFFVYNQKMYSGTSPTKPWTDVCIDMTSNVGKTRVSGPLMFGFSEPIVIHAIERLPGFDLPRHEFKKERGGTKSGRMNRVPDCRFIRNSNIPIPGELDQYFAHLEGKGMEIPLDVQSTQSIMALLKEYEKGHAQSTESIDENRLDIEKDELSSLLQLASDFVGFNTAPSAEFV